MTSDINNPKLEKTALGAIEMVPSEHYESTQDALEEIRANNIPIYSVELTEDAENFQTVKYPSKIALIFGHEKMGVDENILNTSDKKIFVPMRGKKESLNVANCATTVLYEITREQK